MKGHARRLLIICATFLAVAVAVEDDVAVGSGDSLRLSPSAFDESSLLLLPAPRRTRREARDGGAGGGGGGGDDDDDGNNASPSTRKYRRLAHSLHVHSDIRFR